MSATRRGAVALALVTMGLTASLGCSDDEGQLPDFSCFTGRTRVRTPNGDRRLEDLRAGDEVIACDPATGELSVRKVVALIAHAPAETFALDAGDAHLEGVTKEHPIWVASRNAWIAVGELSIGDALTVIDRDGQRAGTRVLESIRATGRSEAVFDLSIEGPEHTFFADDILVHNKSVAAPCYPDCGSEEPDADAGSDTGSDTDAGSDADAGPDAGSDTDTDTDAGPDADGT